MAWSNQDRAAAIAHYRETGSTQAVREEYGVPESTLFSWLQGQVPDEELDPIADAVMSERIRKAWSACDRALNVILDRITNGEYREKNGRVYKVDIPAKDLCTIATLLADRATKWAAYLRNPSRETTDDILETQQHDVEFYEELLTEKKRRQGKAPVEH